MGTSLQPYIAVLRGINVSGRNLLQMDRLRNLCLDMGFKAVQSYIQSGNLVFLAGPADTAKLGTDIGNKIRELFGYEVPVVVLDLPELKEIAERNPFAGKPGIILSTLHVTLLAAKPSVGELTVYPESPSNRDEAVLAGRAVYLCCPDGYGRTKLSNAFFEKTFKLPATTRNWNTLCELLRMASNLQEKP